MKKNILYLLILVFTILQIISCQRDQGLQPTTPNNTNTPPNTTIASLSDTVQTLIGTWYWDSIVHYSHGIWVSVTLSQAAGGSSSFVNQSINFTSVKYNFQGDGSAIDTNYCEALYSAGGTSNYVTQWSVRKHYPLNQLNSVNYFNGNVYQLTPNRLVITDWFGTGAKNGLFYYHHK